MTEYNMKSWGNNPINRDYGSTAGRADTNLYNPFMGDVAGQAYNGLNLDSLPPTAAQFGQEGFGYDSQSQFSPFNPDGLAYGQVDPGNGTEGGFWSGMLGDKDGGGWGMPALKTFGGLASIYLGMKQYGLMKDEFKFNKRITKGNLDNQARLTNARLKTRQETRLAANPNAQGVDSYMRDTAVNDSSGRNKYA
tara:strand:+ start:30 stop:608 length:579 start_codon:yes stop_codon:yes gene_type:complete